MRTINNHFFGFLILTPGISKDAEQISTDIDEIRKELYEKVTAENSRDGVFKQLDSCWDDCSREDWDGYGAKPINAMSNLYAHQFLRALPPQLPNPEVGVDPDGEVSFEWYKNPRQVFSISFAPNGNLNYAGLFGRNKVHGVESFEYDLPNAILGNLKRLLIAQA